ncbi:MAG: FkbM family methyltransferase [Hyphomicrobiales bacterium]|nr:FkbM family methyltransferase [Hyphomicrobiales bacterium]
MRSALKRLAGKALAPFDLTIARASGVDALKQRAGKGDLLAERLPLVAALAPQAEPVVQALAHSRAQLAQDVFALSETGFKRGGFFVEFGAADGVYLSNTHLLEKHYGWTGVLAEPARVWRNALLANRACAIEQRCVWTTTGEMLAFNEAPASELSTIDSFSGADWAHAERAGGERYTVATVSLDDLLEDHRAPEIVDYLSIDTEGSEYDILAAFDFSRRRFRVITCEHNFTPAREKIHALLTAQGYERKFEALSQWDDWYVLRANA